MFTAFVVCTVPAVLSSLAAFCLRVRLLRNVRNNRDQETLVDSILGRTYSHRAGNGKKRFADVVVLYKLAQDKRDLLGMGLHQSSMPALPDPASPRLAPPRLAAPYLPRPAAPSRGRQPAGLLTHPPSSVAENQICAHARACTLAERMSITRLDKHRCLMHFMLACFEDGPFLVLNMILVLLQLRETKECSEEEEFRSVEGSWCKSDCQEWISDHNPTLIVLVFMTSVAALTHKVLQLTFLPSIWASHRQLLKEEEQISDREKSILSMDHEESKADDESEEEPRCQDCRAKLPQMPKTRKPRSHTRQQSRSHESSSSMAQASSRESVMQRQGAQCGWNQRQQVPHRRADPGLFDPQVF